MHIRVEDYVLVSALGEPKTLYSAKKVWGLDMPVLTKVESLVPEVIKAQVKKAATPTTVGYHSQDSVDIQVFEMPGIKIVFWERRNPKHRPEHIVDVYSGVKTPGIGDLWTKVSEQDAKYQSIWLSAYWHLQGSGWGSDV